MVTKSIEQRAIDLKDRLGRCNAEIAQAQANRDLVSEGIYRNLKAYVLSQMLRIVRDEQADTDTEILE